MFWNKKSAPEIEREVLSSVNKNEALQYISEENYENAMDILENIIRINPEDRDIQKKLIEVYNILLKKYAQEKKWKLVDKLFEKIDEIRNIARRII
ncbi:MAG: hypothetical protein ACRC0X_08110 [Brevinema sp.]